jgi:hypothetical protein
MVHNLIYGLLFFVAFIVFINLHSHDFHHDHVNMLLGRVAFVSYHGNYDFEVYFNLMHIPGSAFLNF